MREGQALPTQLSLSNMSEDFADDFLCRAWHLLDIAYSLRAFLIFFWHDILAISPSISQALERAGHNLTVSYTYSIACTHKPRHNGRDGTCLVLAPSARRIALGGYLRQIHFARIDSGFPGEYISPICQVGKPPRRELRFYATS